MIKAVMCDMDGLLLDSEQVCLDAFIEVGAGFDLLDPPQLTEIFHRCVGLRMGDSRVILDQTIGLLMERQVFDAAWDIAIDTRMAVQVPTKAGAKDMLAALHAAGIPVGVATSTQTARARHHLEEAGLLPFLTAVVGGDQVENGKPDPESYLKLADILGFDPTECAAFEDSDTGTFAAVRSGAWVVQVPDLKQPSDQTRDLGHHIAVDLLSGAAHLGLPVA